MRSLYAVPSQIAAAFFLCLFVVTPAFSQAEINENALVATAAPQMMDARVTTTPERARLVIDLAQPTEFAFYTLTDPMRAMVEFRAYGQVDAVLRALPNDGVVATYSFETLSDERIRATLVLNKPVQLQQSYTLDPFEDQPARLVIDLVPDSEERFAQNARKLDVAAGEPTPAVAKLDGEGMAPGETSAEAVSNRPLILLDPGHGGIDAGARSPSGLEEKNIVLAFALKLQNLLVETGKFDVALTRDTDIFLTLAARLELARENQADLFISLHADSFNQEDVRGASVYTRGELSTDTLDKVLAENENRVDLIGGFNPPTEDELAVDALVDLMARNTRKESYKAGEVLIEQLEASIQLRRFPLRQADFYVLNSPDIPSVLVELGFLSNSDDSANLTTDAWLNRVAAALARGVGIYFDAK